MSAPLRGAFCRSLQAINKTITQQRATVVSGPPKYKVSMGEKAGLGIVMVIAVCAPAAYILANLDSYRGGRPE
ncbi:hypothetical protein BaRGS_00028413 [Batillaria attramentaria]|uniref:Uncharacterized protein n=1 Tax=Batillaria attramentaria TaxID=370345 RepID=A0ABD0J1W0_9CAEN